MLSPIPTLYSSLGHTCPQDQSHQLNCSPHTSPIFTLISPALPRTLTHFSGLFPSRSIQLPRNYNNFMQSSSSGGLWRRNTEIPRARGRVREGERIGAERVVSRSLAAVRRQPIDRVLGRRRRLGKILRERERATHANARAGARLMER